MIDEVFVSGEPIGFKALGKILPKIPKKKKPKFTVHMAEFAQYGFCPYTAWHLSKGTPSVLVPRLKRAQTIGKSVHDELDREHEEKIARLPKATEKTRKNKHKPLAFHRNFSVCLYRRSFLYIGKIDKICRKVDGNFYITEDKTSKILPYWPWLNHRLQVWIYCAGMASSYSHKYNAQYLCWQIRYLDKISRECLRDFGGLYDNISHESLLDSLDNFEAIYQGNDSGHEVSPNRCEVCKYRDGCQFKTLH